MCAMCCVWVLVTCVDPRSAGLRIGWALHDTISPVRASRDPGGGSRDKCSISDLDKKLNVPTKDPSSMCVCVCDV